VPQLGVSLAPDTAANVMCGSAGDVFGTNWLNAPSMVLDFGGLEADRDGL
jgi:hypothetical protein